MRTLNLSIAGSALSFSISSVSRLKSTPGMKSIVIRLKMQCIFHLTTKYYICLLDNSLNELYTIKPWNVMLRDGIHVNMVSKSDYMINSNAGLIQFITRFKKMHFYITYRLQRWTCGSNRGPRQRVAEDVARAIPSCPRAVTLGNGWNSRKRRGRWSPNYIASRFGYGLSSQGSKCQKWHYRCQG